MANIAYYIINVVLLLLILANAGWFLLETMSNRKQALMITGPPGPQGYIVGETGPTGPQKEVDSVRAPTGPTGPTGPTEYDSVSYVIKPCTNFLLLTTGTNKISLGIVQGYDINTNNCPVQPCGNNSCQFVFTRSGFFLIDILFKVIISDVIAEPKLRITQTNPNGTKQIFEELTYIFQDKNTMKLSLPNGSSVGTILTVEIDTPIQMTLDGNSSYMIISQLY